jgi:homoserine acetyltransferase
LRRTAWLFGLLCCLVAPPARAADYPAPAQGDYVIRSFPFAAGGSLAELKLHYRTMGQPRKDGAGRVVNAVLVLHGTTGSGAQFLTPEFAGELFGAGQLLDATKFYIVIVDNCIRTADANDVLYALEASWDYDPGPGLGRITAPLLAVNFADDLVNPPELGILEREIARVPRGRAVVIPLGEHTRGHGSHTLAGLWKHLLAELLAASDGRSG